jgi:hypothetical protein
LGPALRLLRAAGLPQLRLGTGVLRGRNVMSLARPLPGALLWFPRRLTAASLSDCRSLLAWTSARMLRVGMRMRAAFVHHAFGRRTPGIVVHARAARPA